MKILYRLILVCTLFFSPLEIGFANENDTIFEDQDIAISPSGQLLAASWNDVIAIFNLQDGTKLKQFNSSTDTPFVLKFSPDNLKLLASGWEKTTVWDIESGKISSQVNTVDNTNCGGFSNDMKNVYFDDEYNQFGHRKLIIADKKLSKEKLVYKGSARCNASTDNNFLALQTYKFSSDGLSLQNTDIKIIDLKNAKLTNTLTGEEAKAYDEDMFFFDENRKLLVRDYSYFHIWDLEKNILLKSWDSDIDVDEISIVKNQMLITADQQRRVWNMLEEPGPIENIPLPTKSDEILSARLSNDGKLYAVTSYNEEDKESALISIFDTKTNTLKHRFKTRPPIYGAHFTNDNTQLILNSYPIKVFDVLTGKKMYEIRQ